MRHDANVALVDFVAYDGEQLYAGSSHVSAGHPAEEKRSRGARGMTPPGDDYQGER